MRRTLAKAVSMLALAVLGFPVGMGSAEEGSIRRIPTLVPESSVPDQPNVSLGPNGTLRGVVHGADGAVAAGAIVRVEPSEQPLVVHSDEHGRFELIGLRTGVHCVLVHHTAGQGERVIRTWTIGTAPPNAISVVDVALLESPAETLAPVLYRERIAADDWSCPPGVDPSMLSQPLGQTMGQAFGGLGSAAGIFTTPAVLATGIGLGIGLPLISHTENLPASP